MTKPGVERPVVIAHRGASGYVPEHTLVAKGIAHAMGADFLEQDVVATKDHQLVVLHDIYVDTISDVALKFPGRARSDGRFYTIDFTLDELQSLSVAERFDPESGDNVFPDRYHGGGSGFRISSLDEEIQFIKNLNRTSDREAGIYPEVKHPAWHREQGCDLSQLVLDTIRNHGYRSASEKCYVQCFDEFETRRIRGELGYRGRLIQLVKTGHDVVSGTDYNRMQTPEGLRDLAKTVDGIGPKIESVIRFDQSGDAAVSPLIDQAHQFELLVHPWTVRADRLPSGCRSLDDLCGTLRRNGVDGVFTDHPDRMQKFLDGKS